MLLVRPAGPSAQQVVLASHAAGAKWGGGILRIPLPAVEVALAHALPEPGATTQQIKVIDQQSSANSLTLTLSGMANSHQTLLMRVNDTHARPRIDGAQTAAPGNSSLRSVEVQFGPGEGYVEKTVKFTW
jgi:hypothetical protein